MIYQTTNLEIEVWVDEEDPQEEEGSEKESSKSEPSEGEEEGDSSESEDEGEEEGDSSEDSEGEGSEGEEGSEEESPEGSEGEDSEGDSESEDSESEEEGDSSEDEDSEGEGSEGEEEGSEGEGDPSEGEGSEGEEEGSEGEEEGSEGEEEGSEGEGDPSEGSEGDPSEGEGDPSEGEGESDPGDPGGGQGEASEDKGFSEELLQALRDSLESQDGGSPLDNNQALAQALAQARNPNGDVLFDEQVWNPSSTEGDNVIYPKIPRGEEGDKARALAQQLRDSVKGEVGSLTSKLRAKFLQARTPHNVHGVRQGQALSERRLVDSFVELRSGLSPTRPDWLKENKQDVSLACAVVLDESGSMRQLVKVVGQAALAVAEPLSNLGSPCLVVGPRNSGPGIKESWSSYVPGCHRTNSVCYDIFKDWDEKITTCWERFGKLMARGSTPLEDGIQFALQGISTRKERHRVILVVTDGSPDNSAVVRRQIRIAKEAGISIIGIGIGPGCDEVKNLFPEHVVVNQISELPRELLRILEGLIFPAQAKKINLDQGGKVSRA